MALILIPGPNLDQTVDENNTTYLEFDITDPNDKTGATKVPVADVTTATMDLSNRSGVYQDITTAQDVKSDIDASGRLKTLLTAVQNDIIDDTDTPQYEDHIATFKINFTAGGDTHSLVKNIRVRVMNQQFIS